MSTATVHLQAIGRVRAKPAEELEPGDVTAWNYGVKETITSVERVAPKTVEVVMVGKDGKEWTRRFRVGRLVGLA
jgi:hypothetical protein